MTLFLNNVHDFKNIFMNQKSREILLNFFSVSIITNAYLFNEDFYKLLTYIM